MLKVIDLPHGWSLWSDPASGDPVFVNRTGGRRHAWEVASQPSADEAVDIFVALKRWLDEYDERPRVGGWRNWRAVDRAKLALQLGLQLCDRWDTWMKADRLAERVEVR